MNGEKTIECMICGSIMIFNLHRRLWMCPQCNHVHEEINYEKEVMEALGIKR